MMKIKSSKLKVQNDLAVRLVSVTKRYTIHHEKPTLVEKFIKGKNETFFALKNINLEIKKGEKVGIIGPNGSGKTTLLKIIAGITTPTNGSIKTDGKIVSLIDLEAGFHPDLTGIQNIFLNGMLLGMGKKDIGKRLEKIVNFADIDQFIDAPLFTYSEGMKLRLGFSVAVNADPEMLLLDENMAVGDQEFKQKSYKKIQEFLKQGKTVIIVSHYLDFIKQVCDRVIWVDQGRVKKEGDAKKIIALYLKSFV